MFSTRHTVFRRSRSFSRHLFFRVACSRPRRQDIASVVRNARLLAFRLLRARSWHQRQLQQQDFPLHRAVLADTRVCPSKRQQRASSRRARERVLRLAPRLLSLGVRITALSHGRISPAAIWSWRGDTSHVSATKFVAAAWPECVCMDALAKLVADFARLLRQGIEGNPGPRASRRPRELAEADGGRLGEDTVHTQQDRRRHFEVLEWAETHLWDMAPGDKLRLTFRRETSTPPVIMRTTVSLIEPLGTLVTRRYSARPITSQQWRVRLFDDKGSPCGEEVFPRVPEERLAKEEVTYLAVAAGPSALRDVSGIEWESMSQQQIEQLGMLGGSLDTENISTYRRVPDGHDRRDFRQLVRQSVAGYRSAPGDQRREKAHTLLSVPKMHLRQLQGSASTRTRHRHLRAQLAGRWCSRTNCSCARTAPHESLC